MAKLRERFWIPKLRALVKSVIHKCNLCKQYRVKRLKPPATSSLPDFRVEYTTPFAATGVDFAGPLIYKLENTSEKAKSQIDKGKIYIAIFTCAATRAVHLELCKDMTAVEFQLSLKSFVARRGTPSIIVSDNAKTFQSTKKWLATIKENGDLFNYLSKNSIVWRFNLARAPWWGGFYERLIGIMKRSLSKSIGSSLLTYDEFRETLLDVECFMNDRPLNYIGEDCDQPVLTPNTLMGRTSTQFLEQDLDSLNYTEEDQIVTKRMRYLEKVRLQLRKRWQNEYLHALQERHTRDSDQKQKIPQPGAIVLLTDTLNQRKPEWRLGKVIEVIRGRDNVIRGMKLKLGNGYIVERPLQLVRDLEICTPTEEETDRGHNNEVNHRRNSDGSGNTVNSENVRPQRRAKEAANDRMTGIFLNEHEEQ